MPSDAGRNSGKTNMIDNFVKEVLLLTANLFFLG